MRARTVDELFELWPSVAAGVRDRSPGTIERTVKLARPFRRSFGSWTLERMETAQPEVARWVQRHRGVARYARTIMLDAKTLGLMQASPFAGVSVPASGGNRRDTDFVPTAAQVRAMAEVGDRVGGFRGWVTVQAACGARLSGMATLQVGKVVEGPTEGTRTAYVVRKRRGPQRAKKGVKVVYPALVLPHGVAALEEALEGRPKSGLVWTRPGGAPWDVNTVAKVFAQIREEAGLPEGATSHCLRRHFATRLVDQGVAWDDVAMLLDHVDDRGRPNTEMTRRHYARPDRDAALARVAGGAA